MRPPIEQDFAETFGRPSTTVAAAPGRVNLIGEHTDYNDGFVLPMPIPQRTMVAVARNGLETVRLATAMTPGVFSFRLGEERKSGGWVDYPQGALVALRRRGQVLPAFDLYVQSTVPPGSGLSSSAALLVATFRALDAQFGLGLDAVTVAKLARGVENDFVGAQVGIMDPFASSVGLPGHALFLDTRDLTYRHVPLPPSIDLIVISSGVRHQHAGGDYNTRFAECQEAARLLGVASLRDVPPDREGEAFTLPTPFGRRAAHVFAENHLVVAAAAALESGDLAALGGYFRASHASQKEWFEVSVPAIDTLTRIADEHPAIFGSRLTGGGFGGSIVAIAQAGAGRAAAEQVANAYAAETGNAPEILLPPPG